MLELTERDEDGLTALHRAAKDGDFHRCHALLHGGADANAFSGEPIEKEGLRRDWQWYPGETPLLLAARSGHTEIVQLLLDSGSDPNLCAPSDWSPLHAAVVCGSVHAIETLANAGADLNRYSFHRFVDEQLGWSFAGSPLHVAATNDYGEVARRLVELGANIGSAWIDHRTPLIYAAAFGSSAVVDVLCNLGANPNIREHRHEYGHLLDYSPLHYAAKNRHAETWRVLVSHGAEPLARESHTGRTALELAQEAGFLEG